MRSVTEPLRHDDDAAVLDDAVVLDCVVCVGLAGCGVLFEYWLVVWSPWLIIGEAVPTVVVGSLKTVFCCTAACPMV